MAKNLEHWKPVSLASLDNLAITPPTKIKSAISYLKKLKRKNKYVHFDLAAK